MKVEDVKDTINFIPPTDIGRRLHQAAGTGLIDKEVPSDDRLRPRFIRNAIVPVTSVDYEGSASMLSVIEEELERCSEYRFSVAFVSEGGIASLKSVLQEAFVLRGTVGKILTSTYLVFNHPRAFKELLKIPGAEVRVYEGPLHAKGYFFVHEGYTNLIVGSSNLTGQALKTNQEWNLKVSSLHAGRMLHEAQTEFDAIWNSPNAKSLTVEWIASYEAEYRKQHAVMAASKVVPIQTALLHPNSMQKEALDALQALRERGEKKALVISATGTGKTYLSAFNARQGKPGRLLFLAHREQLLVQAKESYRRVLGDTVTYGILSGSKKDFEADFLFATIQSVSKTETLSSFEPNHFDWIVVDEVHRAGAGTYAEVLSYFTPAYLFGMTATPERTDGFDIYKMFDHNVAYEIRLQQALENDLLCPFHYFGITDIEYVDAEGVHPTFDVRADVRDAERIRFDRLTGDERTRHVLQNIEYYGYSGSRVRGLVFCSTKEEAAALSEAFNRCLNKEANRYYRTICLTGENSQIERERAIERLESEDDDVLDYIFTVDIFNEGVDIPAVNQIVMLRPTKSVIIFVQQLGRGLRKFHNPAVPDAKKKYVVVMDFIGNYGNNFMIPIALSGDKSLNKDSLRRFVSGGNLLLPGLSTVHFDRIAKEKIYKALDDTKFQTASIIKAAYDEVKRKVGRMPVLSDFQRLGSIDVQNIFDAKAFGSYYALLRSHDEKVLEAFADERGGRLLTVPEEDMLLFVSKKLASGKRKAELDVLERLSEGAYCQVFFDERLNENVEKVLGNEFEANSTQREKYRYANFIERRGDEYISTKMFSEALENPLFKYFLCETLDFGKERYRTEYARRYKQSDLSLYRKYTYEDVCRLLRWSQNMPAQNIGGYKYDAHSNTFAVFINYHKDETVQESIRYEDAFLTDDILLAMSKNDRKIGSKELKPIIDAKKNGTPIYLFVRKDKNDRDGAKEFYFLGEMALLRMEDSRKEDGTPIVKIYYKLDVPVRNDLFVYITRADIGSAHLGRGKRAERYVEEG